MKNKDKFIETIDDIFYNQGDTFGVNEDGNPIACKDLSCGKCMLSSVKNSDAYKSCREMRVDWMNKEYVPPKLTLPKDITMKELLNFFIDHVDNPRLCSECDYVQCRYCRELLFIEWLIENDIIELKADIKMINTDWRDE